MSARRITIALVGAALALGSPGTALASGQAQQAHHEVTTIIPQGGVTMLKLDPATAQVLTDNGVHVRLASEARTSPSGIEFPVVGGRITADTLAGRINHVGGLTFVAGGKSLTVRDFVINTRRARLTAYVDQARARIPLLKLDLSNASVRASSTRLSVRHVPATLTRRAARALNGYFGTTLFEGGLPVGTARVSARILTVKA